MATHPEHPFLSSLSSASCPHHRTALVTVVASDFLTMGKKCFVPRCNSSYKSCSEKVSLFAAPKDSDRLKVWRHAIPRKDRELQTTDFVCSQLSKLV
ncbi:hypothetical protein HPB50_022662 [Hyalomma asiaticum]|uniref:Uncharacterized protein n=1 Tax=Hyalomma asiaticum TaxID=266040 RepID=A0ACB7RW95_HYAAI|nr:hypothetical protein HPB50_022662 [Hyalomma asiaticum]